MVITWEPRQNREANFFEEGLSYLFEADNVEEAKGFDVNFSSATTEDINDQLIVDVCELESLPTSKFQISLPQTLNLFKINRRLQALESVSRIFDELTEPQKSIFEESTKRRPFF